MKNFKTLHDLNPNFTKTILSFFQILFTEQKIFMFTYIPETQ